VVESSSLKCIICRVEGTRDTQTERRQLQHFRYRARRCHERQSERAVEMSSVASLSPARPSVNAARLCNAAGVHGLSMSSSVCRRMTSAAVKSSLSDSSPC